MIWEQLDAELAALKTDGLQRQRRVVQSSYGVSVEVEGRSLLSFCSNDYLGLANNAALREAATEVAARWGVGSGSSHLVCGHQAPHEELEQKLAAFAGNARALFFSTAYMANPGVAPALVGAAIPHVPTS